MKSHRASSEFQPTLPINPESSRFEFSPGLPVIWEQTLVEDLEAHAGLGLLSPDQKAVYEAIKRNLAYQNELDESIPAAQIERSSLTVEVLSSPSLDSGLFTSVALEDEVYFKTNSMRPTDAEGPTNRRLFHSELGLGAEQVLSPKLGSGSDIAVISSRDDLMFCNGRLQPTTNQGTADAWLILGRKFASSMPFEGAVADCPMVAIELMEDGVLVATAGIHAGWRNLSSGIINKFALTIQAQLPGANFGQIYIGPGANGLEIPISSLSKYDNNPLIDKELVKAVDKPAPEFNGFKTVMLDSLKAVTKLLREDFSSIGLNCYLDSSGASTLDSKEGYHSHRRDGRYGNGPHSTIRPEAGRFMTLYHPDLRNATGYFAATPL